MLPSSPPSLIQSGSFTPRDRPGKLTKAVLIATLISCLGPLSFGYVLGYASPATDQLTKRFDWDNAALSWFGSILALGALVGSNCGMYAIDKFGRKLTIMLCSVPFVAGWVIIAASTTTALLYVGRVITGLGIGAISLTVPVYIAEISPAKYRGSLGSGNQLAVTLGGLLAYSFGPLFDDWRWLAIAGAIPPALMAVLMTRMPETPRWLIKNDRISEAIRVMRKLRGGTGDESEEECREIRHTLGTIEPVSFSEIKNPNIYRPLILSMALMIFQQFGGINTVINYASVIFKKAGYKDADAVSIVVQAVQFVATAISCLVVDKLGRRVLLIFPGIIMAFSMALLGASRYDTSIPNYITLISVSLYIAAFSMGWGPIPWLAMSEIFPTRVRGIASGIATQMNWLGVFVVIKTYTQIEDSFHNYGAYWFYGAVCLLSAVYVFFFFPETKGRTLEEIEELFADRHDLRHPSSRLLSDVDD